MYYSVGGLEKVESRVFPIWRTYTTDDGNVTLPSARTVGMCSDFLHISGHHRFGLFRLGVCPCFFHGFRVLLSSDKPREVGEMYGLYTTQQHKLV